MYIHQLEAWPEFKWNQAKIVNLLSEIRHLQGKLIGQMNAVGFKFQDEAALANLTEDVVKTSEIEGEILNKEQVRSTIARRMGIDIGVSLKVDRNIEGIVEIMLDATRHYAMPLTKDRLFGWHAALFPTGRTGMRRIATASWRTPESGTMQVISGAFGREKVHFEAPSYDKVPEEMEKFIAWFNADTGIDLVLKAAVAHLWFLTIHPFEDGNGRIGRVMVDMLLARSERCERRFYSMSAQIQKDRKQYYLQLEQSQKGSLDISTWIEWFLGCLRRAIEASEVTVGSIFQKAKFWQAHESEHINERQRKIINLMLEGFDGQLTSSKWAKICKCSQDTAGRDISDLLVKNILQKGDASGRSVHYFLRGSNSSM
jgi:Fic family protein